ncbi:thioester reductase, partial [Pseudomonas syringae]
MLATSAATFPLTAAQRDVWLDQISRGDSPLYNIGGYLQLSGAVDPVTLHKALEQLVCAHEVLRTVLMPGAGADGMPLQSYAACLPVSLPLHDVSGYPEPEQAARALINDNMRRPYVLDGSPLLDFC